MDIEVIFHCHPHLKALDEVSKSLSRGARSILVQEFLGFNSAGSALLLTTYLAINGILTFTNLNYSGSTNFAARCGW